MKRLANVVFLILAVSSLFPSTALAVGCVSDENFTEEWDPGQDVNARFHDYGRIHMDAENPRCAEAAMYRLTNKVGKALWEDYPNRTIRRPGAFQQWLDGYVVAIIYSAALRMGALGWASRELDKFLITINGIPGLDAAFQHATNGCNNKEFNTCMDDYAGTAAAYAWMSLYKERRAPGSGSTDRSRAVSNIASAFNSVCIWSPHTLYINANGDRVTLCDRTAADLEAPGSDAETLSVNTSQQLIAYGFGLMTSIASAHFALKETAPFDLDDVQKKIARGLFREARKHIEALPHAGGKVPQPSWFKDDCLSMLSERRTNAQGQEEFHWLTNSHCGGAAEYPYHPNHYQLQSYYEKANIGIQFGNLDEYQSGSIEDHHFSHDFGDDGTFSYGRFVTYKYHGYEWWERSDLDFMPYDHRDPIGELEGITPSGLAFGWACDPDTAQLRRQSDVRGTWVDFYMEGHITEEETLNQTLTNVPSEPHINADCGSGSAHRFAVQLPPHSKGKKILAFALDYTWYGHLLLPCKQEPCSW